MRVPTAGTKKGRKGKWKDERGESCPRIQYPRETCSDFIGERWESRRGREREKLAAAARPPALPRAVLRALISSIISFGDAADRWWVRENERESISGNQPPGLRPAARRGERERKYQGTPRSNNPLRPNRPFLPFLSVFFPSAGRKLKT